MEDRGGEVLLLPFPPARGGTRNLRLVGWFGFLERVATGRGMANQPPLPLKAPGLRDGPSRPGRCGAAAGLGPGPNLVLPGGGRWQEEVTRKAQQPPFQADVSTLGGRRVWGDF